MSLATATRSELTKQFTTAIWWILAIVLVAYVGFVAAAIAAAFGASAAGVLPGSNAPQVPAEALAPIVYSTATSVGYVFPLLIGTLIVTTEFRHKTLTPTFLATPRRGTVLLAKLGAGVVLGLLYGLLAAIAAVGVGAGILAALGLPTGLDSSDTWAMVARMLLASVLWVFVGIGVGTTVRNQVATIVIVLAFTQFVEPIGRTIGGFVEGLAEVVQYLPGAAADTLVGSSIFSAMQTGGAEPLEWWVGALVLLAYAVVFLVIGQFSSWRRDVN
jgi:hypothetical protein